MPRDSTSGTFQSQDAESHFVTIVKCDIVESTRVWRKLSRADGLELLRGFKAAVNAVVRDIAVTIEWEGDGAMIAFGYPEVRLDAAEVAVRAGLELVDRVGAVAVVPDVHLEVRVGIASGPMTVDLETSTFESTTIKKAERLKTVAGPGQVVIDEETRRLVLGFFRYDDLGTQRQLKGFEDGVRVWRVLGETAEVSRFSAQRAEGTTREIIGREAILRRLAGAWSAAVAGSGAAICLVGEAGIGKSRLARAALDLALDAGAIVLEIDCRPGSGNSPLLPIGVQLRRTARIEPGASEAEKAESARALLTRLLGDAQGREALLYLAPLFGIQSAPIPVDKTREQVRTATIDAIVAIFRALAAQKPLAVLCEDLHWADDTTAQVAQTLAELIGTLRSMLIVTRRPHAVTPIAIEDVMAPFVTIPVDPLTPSDATGLVRAVAGQRLSDRDVETIVGRCGGVPLLLEEVTRSVLESGDAEGSAGAATEPGSGVPPQLQLIVESRLERWPEFRGILEAAAVLGREFPVPLLEAMLPDRRGELATALSTFAEHGLLTPLEPGHVDRASFRHGLIRDAVYETLVSRHYLRWLHSRAADSLLARYQGTPEASPDVLAQHLRMAERLEEAIKVRLDAGEETFGRGAYVEAKGHCEAVRELIDQVGDKQKVRADSFRACVLLGMVGTGLHGYSAEPAERAYLQAQAMFDDATGAELRYPVTRGLATASLVRGDLATAHRYSLEGLTLSEQSHRPDYRIDAMSVHCYTTLYFGRLTDCRSWIDRCLQLYDSERGEQYRYPVPQDAKTAALALLPTVAWLLGEPEEAEAAITRGLTHVERLGRAFDRALLHAWIAGTRYTQRRYVEALQHGGLAYGLGKEHRFQEWEGVGAMMTLLSQSALQPAPDAVAQAIAVSQEFKAKNVGLNASYFLWGIARGLLNAGKSDDAGALLNAALAVAACSRETRMNPEIWMLQAELEVDRVQVARLLRDAYELAESQGAVANALRAAALLITRTDGDPARVETARRVLDRLDARAGLESAGPGWMHADLAAARRIVTELPRLALEP